MYICMSIEKQGCKISTGGTTIHTFSLHNFELSTACWRQYLSSGQEPLCHRLAYHCKLIGPLCIRLSLADIMIVINPEITTSHVFFSGDLRISLTLNLTCSVEYMLN